MTPPRRASPTLSFALPRRRRGRGPVVVVDNYDSFTLNLAHGLLRLGVDVAVVRNDRVSVAQVLRCRPVGVVVSPGPKAPRDAGISVALIRACARAAPPVPVLGVCLGHQAIGEAFGGRVVRARVPVHGRATRVHSTRRGLLSTLPRIFSAARYHALVVDPASVPAELEVTATSREGEVMALAHRRLPIEGVQFHPESFLTPLGPAILAAFLRRCRRRRRARARGRAAARAPVGSTR